MRRLDAVVVVDLEATCWDGPTPPGEIKEVIEIGVCVLDVATGERRDKAGILVRPRQSRISAFCTELTTLTQEQVDGGVTFAEACQQLRQQFFTPNRIWASWGDFDRRHMQWQCAEFDAPYPFGTGHLNVKSLFALAHGLSREVGLDAALTRVGKPLEGTHHRGVDDAWNIAGLLSDLLLASRSTRD